MPASPPPSPDAAHAEPDPARARGWKGPWGWVTTTYFAEGFPYTIVNSAADALLTVMGTSLATLGLTTILHLPWNLKFLWGPFVDGFETKRRWLLATEVLLCIALAVLALVGGVEASLAAVVAVFMVIAILSATHDIAIDGFYLEGLDAAGQSRFVGYRAAAYRLAMLAVNGPLLVLAAWYGWRLAWLAALVVMVALTTYHALALPRPEPRQRPASELLRRIARPRLLAWVAAGLALALAGHRLGWADALARGLAAVPGLGVMSLPGWIGLGLLLAVLLLLATLGRVQRALRRTDSVYARSFLVFLSKPRVRAVLAFVLLFRTGESFLQKMRWPFLHRQLGVDLDAYGFANGTVGLLATFAATLLGGYLIGRHGLRRFVWPFLLAQNVLNLLYAGLALWPHPEQIDLTVVTAVVTIEHFGAGLGTAVFMVYLMRCCDPEHKAAHMALLTALASVGFTLAGVASGALAEALGYGHYFVLTFLVTLPSMALVLVVPHLDR